MLPHAGPRGGAGRDGGAGRRAGRRRRRHAVAGAGGPGRDADPADLDRAAARGRRPARHGAAPAGDRARRCRWSGRCAWATAGWRGSTAAGPGAPERLDQALAELRLVAQPKPRLPMGFARLAGGRVVVLMDGAAPPGGAGGASAHAGTLAFEMSVGRQRLVVQRRAGAGLRRRLGARCRGRRRRSRPSRSTAAPRRASRRRGSPRAPSGRGSSTGRRWSRCGRRRTPPGSGCSRPRTATSRATACCTSGGCYVDARGQELRGEDILTVADARAREPVRAGGARAAGSASPRASTCTRRSAPELDEGRQLVLLTLPSGEVWMFRAGGGALALEDSVYFDPAAPAPLPDEAGGCPRRGGRVSGPDHLVLRPRRRGARRDLTAAHGPPAARSRRRMFPDLVPIRRALISVSDKTGLADLGRGAGGARGRAPLHRRHRAGAARRRAAGARRVRASPAFPRCWTAGSRRCTRWCTAACSRVRDDRRPRGGAGRVRHRADRPPRRQPLPVRGDGRGGRATTTTASRTSTSAARRCCARRPRTTRFVTVVTDVEDYAPLLAELERTRRRDLARASAAASALTAFGRTAAYDAAVSAWLAGALGEAAPRRRSFAGHAGADAALRREPAPGGGLLPRRQRAGPGVATARQLQGKALSYNNINDTDAAFELVAEFAPADGPACAIIKHANPCGVARGGDACSRPTAPPTTATAPRPSAASSR